MDDFTKELVIDVLASEVAALRAEIEILSKSDFKVKKLLSAYKEMQVSSKNLWRQLELLTGAANALLVQLSEEFEYLLADYEAHNNNELEPILENFVNLVDSSRALLDTKKHQVFSSQEQPEQT